MKTYDFISMKRDLLEYADDVANTKRVEYTGASQDVLMNFKRIANRLGLSPLQVWSVYFNKHVDSVNTYIKGVDEVSEPMESRFADMLNYLFLGMALIIEQEVESGRRSPNLQADSEESSYEVETDEPYEFGI